MPCDLRVPVPPATCKKPAVAGPEDNDDEPMFVETGLTNPLVAANMVPFLASMQGTGENVGIAAFAVFALRYQLRVHIWFGDQCVDVVEEYAPWAVGSVNHRPCYEAVSCRVSEAGDVSMHDHDVHRMNHWVAAIDLDRVDSSTVDLTHEDGPESQDMLFAFYMSLSRLVLKTVADGDCALDAMCLMLGSPRTLASRETIRHACAGFAGTHINNKALIAMLNRTGEMTEHLGLDELETSGGMLMTSLLEVSAPAIHHGHGDVLSVHVPAGIPPAREYKPEEIAAVAWKCRMKPSPTDRVLQVLEQLPEQCLKQMVEEFKGRPVAAVAEIKAKKRFIISRGQFLKHKREAVQQFVDWVVDRYGDGKHCVMLKKGLIPRGCFASYVRAHEPLMRKCKLTANKK